MLATLAAFAMYALRRFLADGCFAASGALSYTTLVSLVPLAVIAFGSLSAFPIFSQVHDQLVNQIETVRKHTNTDKNQRTRNG